MRHEEIEVSILVDVAERKTHPSFRLAEHVYGGTTRHSTVAKRPVPLVDPEVIGIAVVGNVQIGEPVVVEVGTDHAQPLVHSGRDT
jgi:uncharacterized protein YcsI (UPF0317 family)